MNGETEAMNHDPGVEPNSSADALELDLEGSLTIAEVGGLQQVLLNMLNGTGSINLRGGEVNRVDGAGVQLLAALMKEAAQRRMQVHWIDSSTALRTAAAQLGLDRALGLDAKA
ncbi:MAG: STAS domain-containing protein [Gammaproteobacteria bacterium]|nr:STAS domain-containing protein [Gammaproteobacteria bacterium]